MIYLGNNHIGYDTTDLCYPSIAGCQTIVYLTDDGMFGLHNMGGADEGSWASRSAAFATYIDGHINGGGAGRKMYGVCYATGGASRGYGVDNPKAVWLGEIASFADAVGYTGEIWGYDLANQARPAPINVLAHSVGAACVIQVKPYVPDEATRGQNTAQLSHQLMRRDNAAEVQTYLTQATEAQVINDIPDAGWVTVYPEKLRPETVENGGPVPGAGSIAGSGE